MKLTVREKLAKGKDDTRSDQDLFASTLYICLKLLAGACLWDIPKELSISYMIYNPTNEL